jgi:hypothetical protein
MRSLLQRIPDTDVTSLVVHVMEHLIHLITLHENPGWRMTGLSGIEHASGDSPACGFLEIGVRQDDVC